jgi:hypothetical protein
MFGLSSSAGVFGCVADMLAAIYRKAGFSPLLKWVDDFFVIWMPGDKWTEDSFIQLTACLGVPWSEEKTCPLSKCQKCLGFCWDLKAKTVSLTDEKVRKIRKALDDWRNSGARFMAKEALALHGQLVHISCIFPLIQPFLWSAISFANSFCSP